MRPRNWKTNWPALALQQIINTEFRAWHEHARDFAIEPCFVSNIHCNMLCVGSIEAIIGEGHRKRAALLVVHSIGEPDPGCKLGCNMTVLCGQIDTGDMAPLRHCKLSRWAAKTAADIEDALIFPHSEMPAQLSGCVSTSHMKFVDRRKILKFRQSRVLS
jgi:hypothetical protein